MKSFRIWWGKKIGREPGYLLSFSGDSTWKVEKKDKNTLSSRICALHDQISKDSLWTPFCEDKKKEHVVLFFVRQESPDLQTFCPLNIDGPIRNQQKSPHMFEKEHHLQSSIHIIHLHDFFCSSHSFFHPNTKLRLFQGHPPHRPEWPSVAPHDQHIVDVLCFCWRHLRFFCSSQLKTKLYIKILNATSAMPLSKDDMFFQRSICMYFLLLHINLLRDICCIVHVPFYCQTICVVIELLRLQLLRVCFMYRSCPVLSGPDFSRV